MQKELRVANHDYEWHPKYYGVIVGLFCGMYVITNAIAGKMVDIHGLIFTAGNLTFPICAILTDMLTEIYGFNRTRQAIWTTLVCTILFATITQLAITLPPASFWPNQDSFAAIFATAPRIAFAGCVAWLVGEFLNSYVMSKMKIFQNAKHISFRFIGSTVVAQLADTLVFALIAFFGTMPIGAFVNMVIIAWVFKVSYEIVVLPLSVPITNKMKRMEGIEHFDRQKISLI